MNFNFLSLNFNFELLLEKDYNAEFKVIEDVSTHDKMRMCYETKLVIALVVGKSRT